ncbi:MAG: prohibitin family protein [Alphaproteobacteria bacterium]|nr:prohibitin family protein [Alphaproteobacteria bacterium]
MKYILALLALLIIVSVFFGCWYTVNEGTVGVLTRNGKFVATVPPGLGFKLPFIDTVYDIETRNKALQVKTANYSLDTQQYTAELTINYDINQVDVEKLFKQEGLEYAERRLQPLAVNAMKDVAGTYSSQRTIQEREKFGQQVFEAIRDQAGAYRIRVTAVQITNIDFTDSYEQAVENAALKKAEKTKEELELEIKTVQAKTLVVQAEAEASALRAQASGIADSNLTKAIAQAKAITLEGDARAEAAKKLAEAVQATPALADYERAQAAKNWDGKMPQQFVPGSALPMIELGLHK